jgi:hypothetical protein
MMLALHTRRSSRLWAHTLRLAPFALVLGTAGACQTETDDSGADTDAGGEGNDSGADSGNDLGSDLGNDLGSDLGGNGQGAGSGSGGVGGDGPVCETASSETELKPVYLAVAFDVSGSMGKQDKPYWWYDPTFKWVPVSQAMRAFFEDPAARGISATMGMFPSLAESTRCDVASYQEPDVPMTALPSSAFDVALDAYEEEVGDPLAGGNWRGGTPTAAAIEGIATSLDDLRAEEPDAVFAVVLVTDGLPTCPDDGLNVAIDAVTELEAEGIPTYVVGIQNPTEPPSEPPEDWGDDWGTCTFGEGGGDTPCPEENNLEALQNLAVAGGTEEAFLLDTDDPLATQEALTEAMLEIAADSVSCEVTIPDHPNPGETFEPDKIDVVAGIDGEEVRLEYDETCEIPLAWHYDDPADPSLIQLCPEACSAVQADPNGSLEVQFLCEARPPVVK